LIQVFLLTAVCRGAGSKDKVHK